VPFGWGKKPAAPSYPLGGSPSPSDPEGDPSTFSTERAEDRPLVDDVQFRVDAVYSITGEGCVAVGQVESGTLRPPATLRLVTAQPRPGAPKSLVVMRASAHRKIVALVAAGTPAALTLRGVDGELLLRASNGKRWPIERGDRLVAP